MLPPFSAQLNALPPSWRAGGEVVHVVRMAAQTRMLAREGLAGSTVMDVEPGDVAELHEQHIVARVMADAVRVAERYMRVFGSAIEEVR